MEDKSGVERRLHDWSLNDEQGLNRTEECDSSSLVKRGGDDMRGAQGSGIGSDFTTQYLELSEDDDYPNECELGGIDTLGLAEDGEEHIEDETIPLTASDLERNPWDGLPYSSQYYELLDKRKKLAVWQAKDDFVLSLDESPIVLVTGNAGSGKSTQIPQWCAHFAKELGFEFGTVVCTQPHALATASLAIQVSREMDLTSIGNEVGYKMPFSDQTTDETFLKFCTDEVLLREMADDPLLERYGIVIVDEVQERTVSSDILLSLLKVVSINRESFKIVVMSLPHEMPKLEEYFDGVPIVDLSFMEENANPKDEDVASSNRNRTTSKVHYKRHNSLESDYVSDAVETIIKCHCDPTIDGNILVFMPREKEINEVCERVSREVAMKVLRGEASDLDAVTLHRHMPYGLQQAVYGKFGSQSESGFPRRKVVVCDDIAESSFSIDNVAVVIDSGRRRTHAYNCRTRARSDFLNYITNLSADLRSKRCKEGGHIYRLYTKAEFQKFDDVMPPAVSRSELLTDILLMKRLLQRLDVQFSSCQTLDPPAPEAYMQALEDLDYHGALDENGDLSDLGAVMSEFPLPLPLAKSVIASCGEQCTEEMLTIASMLSVPCCFLTQEEVPSTSSGSRRRIFQPAGDHFTLLSIYDAFRDSKDSEQWCKDNSLRYWPLKLATKIRSELVSVMNRLELPASPRITSLEEMETSIKKALLAGFFMQIARDVDGSGNYLIIRDRHVSRLSSDTSLRGYPEWVLFNDFVLSEKNCILTASSITTEMIAEITPSSYVANLPDGEAKGLLLKAVDDLRNKVKSRSEGLHHAEKRETETVQNQPTASMATDDLKTTSRTLNEEAINSKIDTETYPGQRRDSKPYSFKGYDNVIRRPSPAEHNAAEADVFTQTARDLGHAYRQASDYVRNYATEEEEQDGCIIQ